MSKLMSSVLDKISENNNEYRSYLRSLNSLIEELTTNFVGEVVGSTNYTLDFSNAVTNSKEMIVNPVIKTVESYAIKDLRNVETVNEQFIEKINDKLENANITSKEEKEAFNNNLNNLLNNKYLEIVKIKRTNFNNAEGKNDEIEGYINAFCDFVRQNSTINEEDLLKVVNNYKSSLYLQINNTLSNISDLYLNNFTSEVSSSLSGAIDFDDSMASSIDMGKNFSINDTISMPKIPEIPEVPDMPSISALEVPEIPEVPEVPEIPEVPEVPEMGELLVGKEEYTKEEKVEPKVSIDNSNDTLMEIKGINPIEVVEENKEVKKRPLDVEEILKIAKSPILEAEPKKEEIKKDGYTDIKPVIKEEEKDSLDDSFDEEEITKEMIRRLNERLNIIKERQDKYNDEKKKLKEDEKFVNDLIESSNRKKEELDNVEKELDEKEEELKRKQKQLEEKINVVMPFANAVMDAQKES